MNMNLLFFLPVFVGQALAAPDARRQPADIAPISSELIGDIKTIGPGSTIGELRRKFQRVGAIISLGEGRFAYRNNHYIQIDVTYELPMKDGKLLRYMPLDTDRILSVSHPYLSETWVRMNPPHTLNADLKKQLEQLKEIQSVKPGMTRGELEKIFGLPEGMSSPADAFYQYRKDDHIFMHVFFDLESDAEGRLTHGDDDKIIEVSKPMLSDRTRIDGLPDRVRAKLPADLPSRLPRVQPTCPK